MIDDRPGLEMIDGPRLLELNFPDEIRPGGTR